MKLGRRLQHIANTITKDYEHIWDTCCDHGQLGAELLKNHADAVVHFIDIVPQLVENVGIDLKRFFPDEENRWEIHCGDAARLPLRDYGNQHLVVIAGIGGDLAMNIVTALENQFSDLHIDYLLCPVYHQYPLRQRLIELNMGLINESLVEDKGRCYEVIYTSNRSKQLITPIGEQIWQVANKNQQNLVKNHLTNTVNHYRKMAKGNNDAASIAERYQKQLEQL